MGDNMETYILALEGFVGGYKTLMTFNLAIFITIHSLRGNVSSKLLKGYNNMYSSGVIM